MEILGVVLSLAGLMYFAYRGVNVLILAPIMASFAALFQDQAPLMATYTQIFMPALGSYLLKYFPIFMLGAIFGKLMSVSGAAKSVGQMVASLIGKDRAILAVVLACAILTYGGVSLFVVAFCIYPIARDLFSEAKIQKRLIPGAIALGSFTFTMTALPGTPAIQNAIPMPYFNTNAFAAPVLGTVGAIIMFAAGMWWLNRRSKILGPDTEDVEIESSQNDRLPHYMVGLAPLILVVLLNYVLSSWVFPSFNFEYLNLPKFGETAPGKVIGLWSLISAMCISILFLIALAWKHLKAPIQDINKGTMDSLLPIFNTASEVGYGACIASFASFAVIKNAVLGIAPGTPLISEAIAINTLAGITGSASGGLSIALEALGKNYMDLAAQTGLNPELLHRVASMACGGFDTLPHNGAVITLLAICSMDHKRSYAEIFMVAVLFPFLATAAVVLLGTAVGSF
ncbi:MAG: GntP family permease [Bdellovibrionota bacterium]|nr:GntP family permease [Bdellovibrionota bacterium]